MQNFNQDSFGQKLYFNFRQDISANTALAMELEPQEGDSSDVTPVLETADLYVGDEQFLANEYVSYTIQDGDFDEYAGLWKAIVTATLPAQTITGSVLFRVVK